MTRPAASERLRGAVQGGAVVAVVAAVLAIVVVLATGREAQGGAAATTDDIDWCLTQADLNPDEGRFALDQARYWSRADERQFWLQQSATSSALDCALEELDHDELAEALTRAFPAPGTLEEGEDGAVTEQRQALADWAATGATGRSAETGLDQAEELLSSLWVDDPSSRRRSGLPAALVAGAMRAAGELPSYDAHLEQHPELGDGIDPVLDYLDADDGERATAQERERFRDLLDRID